MTAEQLGYVMEQLLEAGALDVYFTSIQMKKNRPGVKLSVLCTPDKQSKMTELLLTQTSTFGVRFKTLDRDILDREFIQILTELGSVRCKIGSRQGKTLKLVPEYEDCKKIAKEKSIPISTVFNAVLQAANQAKMD